MKEPLESHRELQASAEVLSRATFLATSAAVAVGAFLTIGGVVVWRLEWALLGVAVLAGAVAGRAWLQRRGDGELAEPALEALWKDAPAPDEGEATRLLTLLEQWESMEQKRGTPEFDAWELQTLRNDIRKVIEGDPALEAMFERLCQAA